MMLAIEKNHAEAFRFASELLKNDKEFVLKAVSIDGQQLQYVPEPMKSDKDVIIAAVQKGGKKFVPEKMLKDKDIAREIKRQ